MFYVVKLMYQLIDEAFREYGDPRVKHLPLLGSPLPVIGILTLYLLFVLNYGQKWMAKREPFNVKYILYVYNIVQVVANASLCIYGFGFSYGHPKFSFVCQPHDPTNTEPWMIRLIHISYGYYLTKYLDLFDTIFIVLRKKNQQITFLHVYHHAGVLLGVYMYMKFFPGSHSTMLGFINLFVHAMMYMYYFLASLESCKKSVLRWKPYITQLQLLQFGFLVIHYFKVIIYNPCHHPLLISFVGFIQNLFMFALFLDFYFKTYVVKGKNS